MGNMADQNRFWSAKWSNWSENGQWPTVISSTVMALATSFDIIVSLIFYYWNYLPPMATLMTWLKTGTLACFRFSKLSMVYTHTETCLVLAGRAMHRHESHIDGSSTNCTLPLRSYN